MAVTAKAVGKRVKKVMVGLGFLMRAMKMKRRRRVRIQEREILMSGFYGLHNTIKWRWPRRCC